MRIKTTISNALTMSLSLVFLTACGGGGSDPNSPEYQAYVERHELMEQLGDAILPLNEMSQDEIPVDERVFLDSARTIAEQSENLLDVFQNQTLVPESRTMPEVWENWDDFVAKSQALTEAANALVEATENGGFAAGRGLVRSMRDTCGGCHRPYRAPED